MDEHAIESNKPNKIKLIKDYQKIAAGEVIERPASVVKELVENSIDAGSKHITIIIKNFGKDIIQVIDDGCGINEEDTSIAFLPHTSSKIDSAADLLNLHTLGFRGEALHSIAAISKVELITKTADAEMGIKCCLEEGKIISSEKIGATTGTNIKVQSLFYNTPVRYKFLKTDRVEMGHITDIVTRFILCYPSIHFKLIHDEIPIINSPATNNYTNILFDLYGKEVAKKVVEFSYMDENIKIRGYLGDPSLSRNTGLSSSVFVNNRYVMSPLINEALDEAYKDYLMVKKHPFFIILLSLDPATVDFNIHPTKKIIRFEHENELLGHLIVILKRIVTEKFGRFKTEDLMKESENLDDAKKIESIAQSVSTIQNKSPSKQGLLPSQDVCLSNENETKPLQNKSQTPPMGKQTASIKLDDMVSLYDDSESSKLSATLETSGKSETCEMNKTKSGKKDLIPQGIIRKSNWIETNNVFPKIRIPNDAVQLNKVYFILEGEDGFFILDMHAAHERINYEKQIELYKKGGIKKQELLLPIKFDISLNEVDYVKESLAVLPKFGFEVESLGGLTFAIRTVPANFKNITDPSIIKDICQELIHMGKQSSLDEMHEQAIKYIACRSSIKGGEVIDNPLKVIELVQELAKCKNPHHCAHGRPTMLFFSYTDIDKTFHRIQ